MVINIVILIMILKIKAMTNIQSNKIYSKVLILEISLANN